jgi:transposase, IS30 family
MTLFERERLEVLRRGKWSFRDIGGVLHRDHTVLSREYARNADPDGTYRAEGAHLRAEGRKSRPHVRKLERDDALRNWAIARLQGGWTPGMIAGRLKSRPDEPWMAGKRLCHETIYQYIYEGEGRLLGLYQHLVRKRKERRKRHGRKSRNKAEIPFATPIAFRPAGRAPESDSMLYRGQRACLSNQYIPRFQILRMLRVADKSAEATLAAIEAAMESLPYRELWDGLTFDRGTEGALHWVLRDGYGIGTFQCEPYCPWQKGGVERANGVVRRFLPIGTDLSELTDGDIHDIQEKINGLPRKGLGWRTPNEALAEWLTKHRTPDLPIRENGALKT